MRVAFYRIGHCRDENNLIYDVGFLQSVWHLWHTSDMFFLCEKYVLKYYLYDFERNVLIQNLANIKKNKLRNKNYLPFTGKLLTFSYLSILKFYVFICVCVLLSAFSDAIFKIGKYIDKSMIFVVSFYFKQVGYNTVKWLHMGVISDSACKMPYKSYLNFLS